MTPQTHPKLDAMVGYAINYYRDFVPPTRRSSAEPAETGARGADRSARCAVEPAAAIATPKTIQDVVYEIGRREPFLDHKKTAKDGKPGVSLDWFNMLYQVLLGQEKGPRFGIVRGGLWIAEHGRHDRRRAGAVGVVVSGAAESVVMAELAGASTHVVSESAPREHVVAASPRPGIDGANY